MSSITTDILKIRLAENFIDTMVNSNNSLYMYIGKETPWQNEPNPDQPHDSVKSYKTIWDDMIVMKKVTQNNLQLVIKKNVWTNNLVYTAYSDENFELFNSTNNPFYIINSNNEVYKCLSNNNSSASTIEPSGIGNSSNNYVTQTSDGYQWKYMLNIDPADTFLNNFWIPIPRIAPTNSSQSIIENSAVPGSIDVINVINGGSGYTNSNVSYIVNITGDGIGANAYATVINGSIQNVVMVNRGRDYTYANVSFTGTGSGANAIAIMPPSGGHGSNAVNELGAGSVMISISTVEDESGYFTVSNSFRQTGLILNPLKQGSNTVSSNNLVKTVMTFNMSGGIGSYINGETVYQGSSINNPTFSGIVVDFDSVSGSLRMNNIRGALLLQTILYGMNSGAQRYPTNIITPDVEKYTGDIIYINNGPPIQRAPTNIETYQFVINF